MKMIKLFTNGKLLEMEYPEGNLPLQELKLQESIGAECDIIQRVAPPRLYTEFDIPFVPDSERPGAAVCMLVDEEYSLRRPPQDINWIASYLYETDKHKWPILGNVLFVGVKFGIDGPEYCGIEENTYHTLLNDLRTLAEVEQAVGV